MQESAAGFAGVAAVAGHARPSRSVTPAQAVALDADRPPGQTQPPASSRPTRGWARRGLPTLLDAGAVTALTVALLVVVLHLWEALPKIPFGYAGRWSRKFFAGDATGPLALARGFGEGEWWWRPNLHLGAPLGQDLRDFPQGPDHVHLLIVKGLVELLGDPFAAVNAYYLLGYVLVALSAWGVLRLMGISRPVAVVVGVLFTFLPFHAGRGPEHLFLSAYFSVPLAGLLLHWQLTGRAAWGPARRGADAGLTRGRLAGLLLIALVVGSSSAYYALHFLVLLAFVTVLQVLIGRTWRPVLSALLVGTPVLGVLLLNAAPALLYTARNGANAGLSRAPDQSWFFGMKLSQLLMPVEDHRLDVLAGIERAHRVASGFHEPGHNLGLIGAAVLLMLGVTLLRRLRQEGTMRNARSRLRGHCAGLALLAALIATAGGGSLIVALAGFGEARVWARMSIYIGFFALCALATWLDDALDWWRGRGLSHGRWAVWPVLLSLLVVGVWDQTSPEDVPRYQETATGFDSDYTFMRRAAAEFGEGAMVWQLPYMNFPEGGLRLEDMFDYDHFKGYLHAPELRWSYGAVKSRPASLWQTQTARRPLSEQLPMVVAAGFSAIYLDTYGLPERGRAALSQIRGLLGRPGMVSKDGRLVMFDLRPLAQRLERTVGPEVLRVAGTDVLQLNIARSYGAGFGVPDFSGRWVEGADAALSFDNPGSADVEVEIEMLVGSRVRGAYQLRVQGPGADQTVQITQALSRVSTRAVLPPGPSTLRLTSNAPREPLRTRTKDRTFFVGEIEVHGPQLRRLLQQCGVIGDRPQLLC